MSVAHVKHRTISFNVHANSKPKLCNCMIINMTALRCSFESVGSQPDCTWSRLPSTDVNKSEVMDLYNHTLRVRLALLSVSVNCLPECLSNCAASFSGVSPAGLSAVRFFDRTLTKPHPYISLLVRQLLLKPVGHHALPLADAHVQQGLHPSRLAPNRRFVQTLY